MKRIDYYFGLSVIGFILCLGFEDIHFNNIGDYFMYIANEGDVTIFYHLSLIFFIFMVYFGYKVIRDILKK